MGAAPVDMRIKPKAGFMEVDIRMSTEHNFNKYMGLKWGDAANVARHLHNTTATYGPAAGLIPSKPRSMYRGPALKDSATRDQDLDRDLQFFSAAVSDNKVLNTLTLGGQIIRHDTEQASGKPHYFVGAFQGDQLHLTKVNGTVQMRPNFHHIDAEEERARISASRAHAENAATGAVGTTVSQKQTKQEDQNTIEARMKKVLLIAQQEQWIRMQYVDDEAPEAYEAFDEKLKVRDVINAPHLKSELDNDAFLDAISAPRNESPNRRKKRASRRRDTIDLDEQEMPGADVAAGGGCQ